MHVFVGWGWGDSDSDKEGGDLEGLIGLIGLLGLAGLTGVVPLIIKAIKWLIILSPVLVPLAVIKLPFLLISPALFGRGSTSGNGIFQTFQTELERAAERLGYNHTFSSNTSFSDFWLNNSNNTIMNEILSVTNLENEILGKDADSQCMQRIACEGLMKSIPRIFLKFVGDNTQTVGKKLETSGMTEKNKQVNLEGDSDSGGIVTARRKDLATVALNRLKYPATKKRPITEDIVKTDEVCKQYKCSTLF